MTQLKHQDLLENFPRSKYPRPKDHQVEALRLIAKENGLVMLELPTGTGKTAIGYTFLKTVQQDSKEPVFYLVHTKTLVDQVKSLHPDVKVIYGRQEHPCLFYKDNSNGTQITCSSLLPCPHQLNPNTGETDEPGVKPCPYDRQNYEAKQGGVVACTTAFYLFSTLFANKFEIPDGLVIDEVHKLAATVRQCLSYQISDWHLSRAVDLLEQYEPEQAKHLRQFMRTMIHIIKKRPAQKRAILEPEELQKLMDVIGEVDQNAITRAIKAAIKSGEIDVTSEADLLDKLDVLVYDVARYYRSFSFSLPESGRHPLNYTYAYYRKELLPGEKVQYTLVIKSYYVAPLIRKILSPATVAYSATIGEPQILTFETGLEAPFHSLPSDFPANNTRIYMPTDTPDLSLKGMKKGDKTKALTRIAKACRRFNHNGFRCLVVVISNDEKDRFLELCKELGVDAISYGNGVPAREAAARFKEGEGSVLVGTAAHYAEGVDLPKGIAPVIFFLRPGFPNPDDPGSVFEERRFGSQRWKIWNWRVMIEAMQVRGRNIRSSRDVGITIFVSQQFRRFVFGALPQYLHPSYRGDFNFEKVVSDSLKVLKGEAA